MHFFDEAHYATFDEPKPKRDDPVVRQERLRVRDRLLELDEPLWPFIENKGWDLHRHRHSEHWTSSYHFVFSEDNKPIVDCIDGMWLHYGKSPEQLDFVKLIGGYDYKGYDDNEYYNAFYLHTRIQFYINADVFRAWLLLATDKNYYDRSEFLRRIRSSATFWNTFFDLNRPLLGKGFFYEIGGERFYLTSGISSPDFLSFIKTDKHGLYSGIVKEYEPNDPLLDSNRIVQEMKQNLEMLYPLYDFMAWRPRNTPV